MIIGRFPSSVLPTSRPPQRPKPGDYLTDGTALYCVEEVLDAHALIEDCRTGVLIDIDTARLCGLELVRARSADGGGEQAAADGAAQPS